jgi:transposase
VGRSRGGLTTKLHLLADGEGKPVKLLLTGGQVADCTQALPLLKGQKAKAVLADKGYDTDAIIRFARRSMKAKAVIPPKKNRTVQRRYYKKLYKERNLIERAFNKLKHWRRIATRYDRVMRTSYHASLSLQSLFGGKLIGD